MTLLKKSGMKFRKGKTFQNKIKSTIFIMSMKEYKMKIKYTLKDFKDSINQKRKF